MRGFVTRTVELKVENGIIVDYAQDVKACALGQAAASVVGQNIVGLQKIDVQTARDELHSMLMSEGTLPSDPFSDLRVLEAAKSYPGIVDPIQVRSDFISSRLQAEE